MQAHGNCLPQALNFRPQCLTSTWSRTQMFFSAGGYDDKSQMCHDFPVWLAQSYSLCLPFLVNYLLSLPPSVLWPCKKPCIINYLHILHTSVWLLLSIYCGRLSMQRFVVWVWLRMHVLCMGKRVHFDAQFKVGWHYLFMPLLFLFPLRVKNFWRSILGRSRLTQTESIASQLNETHACAHTFRRCSLSIHLPPQLLFVGPSCLRLTLPPQWISSYIM